MGIKYHITAGSLSSAAPDFSANKSMKIGFFFSAPAVHHLYYLLPYIRTTAHRSVMVFAASEDYLKILNKVFPDINFISCQHDKIDRTLKLFKQYKILMFANSYQWFNEMIFPEIKEDIMCVRTLHGASHKFADDKTYYQNSVYAWDAAILHGLKDIDMFYDYLKVPENTRVYNDFLQIENSKNNSLWLIQGGNQRADAYFKANPTRQKVAHNFPFINPEKKTILVMPTHPNNPDKSRQDYSSLDYFLTLLDGMKQPEQYNFLFKLHPLLIFQPHIHERIQYVCQQKNIQIPYDIFTPDYFPFMQMADLLITDRISSVFDFLYFDEPILFLDSAATAPNKISWEDRLNPYWSFQLGPHITPEENQNLDTILANNIANTPFRQIRHKARQYSFEQNRAPADVMATLLTHPKI